MKGWIKCPLREVTSKIGSGATPLGGETAYQSSGISLIRSLNVHDAGFHMKDLAHINEVQARKLDNVIVETGDVLLNITGASVARCCIVPESVLPARVNQHVSIIRPSKDRLLPQFLHYLLVSNEYKRQLLGVGEAAGSTRQAITKAQLQDFQIQFPESLDEQRRIVGVLDEAFAGLATAQANAEKNLQNARDLFESHLHSIFCECRPGWVKSTLGNVTKFIDYRGKTPVKTADGIRLITAKNVKMGYIQDSPREFIAADSYAEWMTRGVPKKGDVLFTTEAPLANVAQLDTEEKVAFAQRIIIMQPDSGMLNSTFLKYLLLSQPVQHSIRARGTGATVQGIKASLLKLIEICFPYQLSTQGEIVHKLDRFGQEVQRLEANYKQKLSALDELKKSLLHQAFAGKV